ncbi:hypothetical protein QTP88_024486 [Uroleucon formosanum]
MVNYILEGKEHYSNDSEEENEESKKKLNLNTWKDIEKYKQAKEVISSLKIVNDAAERGVKFMEEYNEKFSKNEDLKQFTLQVVQEYRKTFFGCSREVLKKNFE